MIYKEEEERRYTRGKVLKEVGKLRDKRIRYT